MAARIPLVIFLMLALATPAMAAPTLPENLYYHISWNGLSLGRIRVSATETKESYHMVVDTKSRGVASMFAPFKTVAQVRGIKRGTQYIPSYYETRSEKSDEGNGRSGHIRYDATGKITERVLSHPDDPAWRPVVPIDKASAATDPITCFIAMRPLLIQNKAQGVRETILRSYDNKRLANLRATILDNNPYKDTIATRITREPLDGYTPKEVKKYRKGDPTLTVWFSEDRHVMPTRLELELMLGTIIVKQTKE